MSISSSTSLTIATAIEQIKANQIAWFQGKQYTFGVFLAVQSNKTFMADNINQLIQFYPDKSSAKAIKTWKKERTYSNSNRSSLENLFVANSAGPILNTQKRLSKSNMLKLLNMIKNHPQLRKIYQHHIFSQEARQLKLFQQMPTIEQLEEACSSEKQETFWVRYRLCLWLEQITSCPSKIDLTPCLLPEKALSPHAVKSYVNAINGKKDGKALCRKMPSQLGLLTSTAIVKSIKSSDSNSVRSAIIYLRHRMLLTTHPWSAHIQDIPLISEEKLRELELLGDDFIQEQLKSHALFNELQIWERKPTATTLYKFAKSSQLYLQRLGLSCIHIVQSSPGYKLYLHAAIIKDFIDSNILSNDDLPILFSEDPLSLFDLVDKIKQVPRWEKIALFKEISGFIDECKQLSHLFTPLGYRTSIAKMSKKNKEIDADLMKANENAQKWINDKLASAVLYLKPAGLSADRTCEELKTILLGILMRRPAVNEIYSLYYNYLLICNVPEITPNRDPRIDLYQSIINAAQESTRFENSIASIKAADLKQEEEVRPLSEIYEWIYQGDLPMILLLVQGHQNHSVLCSLPSDLVEDLQKKISSFLSDYEKQKRAIAVLDFFTLLSGNIEHLSFSPSILSNLKTAFENLRAIFSQLKLHEVVQQRCTDQLNSFKIAIKHKGSQRMSLVEMQPSSPATFSLFDLPASQFVSKLEAYFTDFFVKIHPSEFDQARWGDDKTDSDLWAPNLRNYIRRSTWLTQHIVHGLLKKGELDAFKWLEKSANLTYNHGYLDIAGALITAMERYFLDSLREQVGYKPKWPHLSYSFSADKNYKTYRLLESTNSICLPYLPVILKDITFCLDGNPPMINGMMNLGGITIMEQQKSNFMKYKTRLLEKRKSISDEDIKIIENELLASSTHNEDSLWALSQEKRQPQ